MAYPLRLGLFLAFAGVGVMPLTAQTHPRPLASTEALQIATSSGSQNALTIEHLMDFNYPEELSIVAAPKGDRIAWAENKHGVRNIMVADAPQWIPRQVTHYQKDDGQELTNLAFSSDGNLIIYTRGGAKNRDGEVPDPDGDPAGAEQAVWKVLLSRGAPQKVDNGSAPKIAPNSSAITGSIGYLKEGKIWIAPLGTGRPFEVFAHGQNTDVEWSPNGKQIAFVSTRSGHSLIPIYDVATRQIHYVTPSVDRDTYPRWSPDGRYIAFVRTPVRFGEPGSNLTAPDRPNPWAIWLCETADGNTRELWHSGNEPNDSLPNLPGNTIVSWGAGDTVVFSSEQDGWQHLYSIPASNGSPQLLTPGNFEYDYMSYSPDRKTILFSSNCEDIDRRHLWQVALAGGPPQQVTLGEGLEWWPIVTGTGKWLAFLGSNAQHPAAPFVRPWSPTQPSEGKAQTLARLPADFPDGQLVTPKQVIFKAADGLEIHGQLFLPANAASGEKHPAIVHMHGGPQRQLLLGWHPMLYYSSAYAVHQYMVSRGYIVIEVNYRSGIGYGREFRMAKNRGARGASEYQDIVAAANYLRSRDDVDAKRIGLWGGSYGGFLTAMGLARNSDIFAAGVDFHGVHDWTQRIGFVTGNSPMVGDATAIKIARDSSPIASISQWRSPVLLIQGDDDRNVDFGQMIELVPMLRRQGIEFEQLILPDEVHDFLRWDSWMRSDHATVDFFDRKLRGGANRSKTPAGDSSN